MDLQGECVVEVHMTVEDASEPVAKGTIHFLELLGSPQNRIHTMVSLSGINKHDTVASFGVIQCWFHLGCSVHIINDYVQLHNITKFKVSAKVYARVV